MTQYADQGPLGVQRKECKKCKKQEEQRERFQELFL